MTGEGKLGAEVIGGDVGHLDVGKVRLGVGPAKFLLYGGVRAACGLGGAGDRIVAVQSQPVAAQWPLMVMPSQ